MYLNNNLGNALGEFSFYSDESGDYLKRGDNMYLLSNKPLEIPVWSYILNGSTTYLQIDTTEYTKLSIGNHSNSSVTLRVYGVSDSKVELTIGADSYYDIIDYNLIQISVNYSTAISGTVTGIKLW